MNELTTQPCDILIVDDKSDNILFLEMLLQHKGYQNLRSTQYGHEVLPMIQEKEPDLILLDLRMPGMDGFEVIDRLKTGLPAQRYIPILVLTAESSPEVKRKALDKGADDFLSKPLDAVEVLLRVRNMLKTRLLYLALQDANQVLEHKVQERTKALSEANTKLSKINTKVLERLALAAEFRDDDTGEHTYRVGQLAALTALCMGLDSDTARLLAQAARLHDVGKIGVPDSVLLKPGKLTEQEFELMQAHTTIGAQLLLDEDGDALLNMAREIALSHHERWDGQGYPYGIQDTEIPLMGRIVAVVDVFDALTHHRPYKKAWSRRQALEYIKAKKGSTFDPEVVEAFTQILETHRSNIIDDAGKFDLERFIRSRAVEVRK